MPLIVIVDDRATNRTIYSKLALSIGEGVAVRAFDDPADALKWLGRNRPDLIVTDYDMPQLDREEFISRFRGLPHSAGVPIMMITVCDQRKLRLRALESGATDFLTSPIDHYEFLMRARNLLKLSQDAGLRIDGATGEGADCGRVEPEAFSAETRRLLAQCGDAEDYALHVLEPEGRDDSTVLAFLQAKVRADDAIARLDRRSFAILQRNVESAADAEACARRLRSLGAIRIGTALPQADLPDEARAAACLREAASLARDREAARFGAGAGLAGSTERASGERRQRQAGAKIVWRLSPRVDLGAGAIVGAQILANGAPAEIGRLDRLRATLSVIATLRRATPRSTRFSLRLRLTGAGAASALRLAPLLSQARVPPACLDLLVCAREALIDTARAEAEARALRALGLGLTLDLGALGPQDLLAGDQWAALLGAFVENWCDAIQFPASGDRAFAVARRLRFLVARRVGRAPPLFADGVRQADMLEPLLLAGARQAQGPCFGAPFSIRDFKALFESREPVSDSLATDGLGVEALASPV
jgi:CheY-like chemotaxis protein